MRIVRFDDPGVFAARAEPYLAQHEAEHCLPLGIISRLRLGLPYGAAIPYLALAEGDGGDVIGAAVMTPPFGVVLARTHPAAIPLLAQDVHAFLSGTAEAGNLTTSGPIPNVQGGEELALAFAQAWQRETGQGYQLGMAERIYQLEHVIPPAGIVGSLHPVTLDDRDLLFAWFVAFDREAFGAADPRETPEDVARMIASGARVFSIWEAEGTPVCMAGYTGPTPHGMRIGPVYTPPEHRSRGYASACVAQVSQQLLDAGRRFCFLFTDRQNLISNHVYQKIGYEPVCDVAVYRFSG